MSVDLMTWVPSENPTKVTEQLSIILLLARNFPSILPVSLALFLTCLNKLAESYVVDKAVLIATVAKPLNKALVNPPVALVERLETAVPTAWSFTFFHALSLMISEDEDSHVKQYRGMPNYLQ